MVWVGADDQLVFAVTKKHGLDAGGFWRSNDGGKSWTEKTMLLNDTIKDIPGEPVNIVGVYAQKSAPKNVAILGSGTFSWVSKDGGDTWTKVPSLNGFKGSGIKVARLHPRKDNWLMLQVKRVTCRTTDHKQMECPYDLLLTQDLFGTMAWKNLTADANGKIAGFVDFDWGANLCPGSACPTCTQPEGITCPKEAILDDTTVFATMYAKPGDYDQPWDPDVKFVKSDNWFTDFTMNVPCGNMFELVGHSVYLAFANSCPTDIHGNKRSGTPFYPKGITLYTSINGGRSFTQACLPVALEQEGYELLETHDGSGALIIVDYRVKVGSQHIPASSVYTSGPHHALFSMSLTNVYHAALGFGTDFAKVDGLPGVFIANQMSARDNGGGSAPVPKSYDDVDIYGEYSYDYELSGGTIGGAPLVETKITFNSGGRWQRLRAPTTFNYGRCNRCDGRHDCFLHLHGISSWSSMTFSMPAVYTNPSAPGFIMATGNVGPTGVGLDDFTDGQCTWLSTDGGVSWTDIGEGAFVYEYADWGGVIFMARHPGLKLQPADEILFSVDYGKCWHRVPLSTALLVENINIEPDGQRPRVLVQGHACRKSQNDKCSYSDDDRRSVTEGILYMVDVTEILAGSLGPCAKSDYERFTLPTGPNNATARCVLGEQLSIYRRKPSSVCLNGGSWTREPLQRTPCNCTKEVDFECDYGWARSRDEDSPCLPLTKENLPKCPVLESKQYTTSSNGLRMVHGDMCMNHEKVCPDCKQKAAPPAKMHGALFNFFMWLVAVAIVGGLIAAWWTFMASDTHRDAVRDTAASAVGFCASLWALVMDKIRGRHAVPVQEQDLGYFQPLGDGGANDAEERGIFTLR